MHANPARQEWYRMDAIMVHKSTSERSQRYLYARSVTIHARIRLVKTRKNPPAMLLSGQGCCISSRAIVVASKKISFIVRCI